MTPVCPGAVVGTSLPRAGSSAAVAEPPTPEVAVSKKQLKRLLDGHRPLDAWERYRALNDAIGEAYDSIDVNNREARFALIMLGGLNALMILGASRSDLAASLQLPQRAWIGALLVVYAGVAMFFLLEAITALRPRKFRPHLGSWSPDSDDFPARVRYYEDVVTRDVHSHWHAWKSVQLEQLNAELAIQLHSLSQRNQAMRSSLRRLYTGLRVMTLLVTALLMLFVYSIWA
jgi:hypothetical protein